MSSSMEIFKKSEEGILKVIFSLILLFTNLKVTQCNQHYQDPITNSTCGSPTLSVSMCYCHRGNYKDWSIDKCEKCSPGYFSEHNNGLHAACHLCSFGKFANESGQSSCKLCPAGKFGNSSNPINPMTGLIEGLTRYGATSCAECPIGFYSIALNQMTDHDIPCEQCPTGKYNDVKGSFKCSLCARGKYQNELGKSECKFCPLGQWNNNTNDEKNPHYYHLSSGTNVGCWKAKRGHYSNDRTSELKCPKGKYADGLGFSECKLCEAGKYTDSTGSEICTECGLGEYQPLQGASEPCKSCALGKFSYEIPKVNCSTCKLGSYDHRIIQSHLGGIDEISNVSICFWAKPGYYAPAGGLEYKVCEKGKYTSEFRSSSCIQCPLGKHTANQKQSTTCIDATMGHFAKNGINQEPCPSTTYNDERGKSSCKQCELGRYSEHEQSKNCSIARKGHYAINGIEYVCNQGSYANKSESSFCTTCEAGKYQHRSGSSSCDFCRKGSASKVIGLAEHGCPLCEPGQFTNNIGSLECTLCSIGRATFSNSKGLTKCESCLPGTFSDSKGLAKCKNCLPGTYSDLDGSEICKTCEPGRYSWLEISIDCRDAEEGHIPIDNHTNQIACKAGTIAPGKANTKCLLCNEGSFVEHDRAVECNLCESGKHQHLKGQIMCEKCIPGKYSDELGASTCTLCPAGRTRSGTAAEITEDDAHKFLSDIERHDINNALNQCHKCKPGRHQPNAGSDLENCPACPIGTFVAEEGAEGCNECGIYHYTTEEGSTKCELCFTLTNSFGIFNLEQCIISVYIFSGAIIFLCCCCSCIIWCCRGCPLPKKKIKRRHKIQKKSSSSIQYEKHKSTNVEEGLEWKIQEMIALKLQEQKICSDTSLSEMKKQSASDIIKKTEQRQNLDYYNVAYKNKAKAAKRKLAEEEERKEIKAKRKAKSKLIAAISSMKNANRMVKSIKSQHELSNANSADRPSVALTMCDNPMFSPSSSSNQKKNRKE